MKNTVRCSLLFMALLIAASVAPGRASAFDEETNKKVIKDALVGAVTGYAAVEATKDNPQAATAASTTTAAATGPEVNYEPARHHHGKGPKGHGPSHRPPGWDRGKKTGWQGSDVPPGLKKK